MPYDRGFSCGDGEQRRKEKEVSRFTLWNSYFFSPLFTLKTYLLVLEEREQADARDLDDLKADTGDITHGVPGATETSNQHLVLLDKISRQKRACVSLPPASFSSSPRTNKTTYVFVDEVEATIPGHESGDLLPVLDQLYSHALTNSGVRLLGLNTAVMGGEGETSKEKSVLVISFAQAGTIFPLLHAHHAHTHAHAHQQQ